MIILKDDSGENDTRIQIKTIYNNMYSFLYFVEGTFKSKVLLCCKIIMNIWQLVLLLHILLHSC